MEPSEEIVTVPMVKRHHRIIGGLVSLGILAVLATLGFSFVYSGKIYPGISVAGEYVGGLDKAQAVVAVNKRLEEYRRELIPVSVGSTTTRISPDTLDLTYDTEKAVERAFDYGRQGSWFDQLQSQVRAMLGRPNNYAVFDYSDDKLAAYLDELEDNIATPVSNASFNFSGSSVTVNPSKTGRHLNIGAMLAGIEDRLSQTSSDPLEASVSEVPPTIDTDNLESVRSRASVYLAEGVTLTDGTKEYIVGQDLIATWLKLTRPVARRFEDTNNVVDLVPSKGPVILELDQVKIAAYVADLAGKIDQPGQNAALSIADGRAVVFQPSRDGIALDQDQTMKTLNDLLSKSSGARNLRLAIKVSKPEVTEDSLNDLGIKELISEGVSYFTGSNAVRINNIRLGAALYNGLLVKPGETFSFNQYFVNVDAAHGWAPGLSIVGNKIEPIYGGGICQVSSTAYRAALLAGLPINERTNHAYAVNFYSQPFGTPGVDATVYNPGVDFKFTNDTGSYILIQTRIVGYTLYFDFYGTKTKSGRIRGPFFIDGTNDYTKPSTTVFYRDILDLTGKVTQTDPVTTHYKSSLDFVHVDTP